MTTEEKVSFVQIVGQILIEDGVLSDVERSFLDRLMGQLELDPDQQQAAFRGISVDGPVQDRASALSEKSSVSFRKSAASAATSPASEEERALLARLDDLFAR